MAMDLQALAKIIQRKAEEYKALSDSPNLPPGLQVYASGASDAFGLVAFYVREALSPTVATSPKLRQNALVAMFKAHLEMLEVMGNNGNGEKEDG
jgi:hypothetical protein